MPRELLTFTTAPYDLAVRGPHPPVNSEWAYSGRTIVIGHQWGVATLNADTNAQALLSGVSTVVGNKFPRPAIEITGDCHESLTWLAASPGAEKWIVYVGTPPMCAASGKPTPALDVQVYRCDGGLRRVGQVAMQPGFNRVGVDVRLEGDIAYVRMSRFQPFYAKIDLNQLIIVEQNVLPPVYVPQSGIDGLTYDFVRVDDTHWELHKQGGPPVMRKFCPEKQITRKQVAAIVYNAMKAASSMPHGWVPPVPAAQQFEDVAMGDPFRPAIDALAAADIVAGMDDCE